jgi:hypothetical protein
MYFWSPALHSLLTSVTGSDFLQENSLVDALLQPPRLKRLQQCEFPGFQYLSEIISAHPRLHPHPSLTHTMAAENSTPPYTQPTTQLFVHTMADTSSTESFHPFSRLPAELRLYIWACALPVTFAARDIDP